MLWILKFDEAGRKIIVPPRNILTVYVHYREQAHSSSVFPLNINSLMEKNLE